MKGGGRGHPPAQRMKKGSRTGKGGGARALHFLSWRLDLQFKESEKVKTKEKQRKSMKQNAVFFLIISKIDKSPARQATI